MPGLVIKPSEIAHLPKMFESIGEWHDIERSDGLMQLKSESGDVINVIRIEGNNVMFVSQGASLADPLEMLALSMGSGSSSGSAQTQKQKQTQTQKQTQNRKRKSPGDDTTTSPTFMARECVEVLVDDFLNILSPNVTQFSMKEVHGYVTANAAEGQPPPAKNEIRGVLNTKSDKWSPSKRIRKGLVNKEFSSDKAGPIDTWIRVLNASAA